MNLILAFMDFGWLIWPAALVVHVVLTRCAERHATQWAPTLHLIGFVIALTVMVAETHWQVRVVTDGVWASAASVGLAVAVVRATIGCKDAQVWPFRDSGNLYLHTASGIALVMLGIGAGLLNLVDDGTAPPLPFVPLLNPLELVSVALIVTAALWFQACRSWTPGRSWASAAPTATAGFALLVLTMSVARTAHHWFQIPFNFPALASSNLVQASVSIVWGAVALLAMVRGATQANRTTWLVGAALMAVVVIKLFLVELAQTATLGRVVSFLGVGVLLLVVGYLAPAPPRPIDNRAA